MLRSTLMVVSVVLAAAVAWTITARAADDDGAVIKGRAVFKGDAKNPEFRRKVQDTSRDPNCKKRIGTWQIILNPRTDPVTVRYVLVSVKEGLGDRQYDPPEEPKVLNQEGCEYDPHVLGIQVGQPLRVKNSDPTNHNIHFQPERNPQINFSQPRQNMERDVTDLVVEKAFKVKCDVHPWMGAYIAVFEHPFFDVTGEEGTFELKGLPPGKYVVEAWHETFGALTQTVEVGSGETKELDFVFEPKGQNKDD